MSSFFMEMTNTDAVVKNPLWWKEIVPLFLKVGEGFEIRHWREDEETIKKYSSWGKISEEDSGDFEVSLKGSFTKEIIYKLLMEEKPEEREKMTDFFSINIGRFHSSHYGKEIAIDDIKEDEREFIRKVLLSLNDCFNIVVS